MKVILIGAGPGDPGLLTIKGREMLAAADVVVYDALANESLLQYARPDAEKIYVGKVAGDHALPQQEINALLVQKAKGNKVVARLKGGDPFIFGRGGEEAEVLATAGVPFEVIPGISSTIAAPAYAGIPLTHRDAASSVTIITGHENPDKPGSAHNWKALAASASTLVFVMGMKNLPDIVRNLIAAGMDSTTPSALIYRGTTPAQRSLATTLAELPRAAREAHFTNPSIILVGKVASLRNTLNWFEKKPLFGISVVVTRAREQASELAQSLAVLGAEVIQCPTIEIHPLRDYTALDTAIAALRSYHWCIFTSVNGVRFFWLRMQKLGFDSRALGNIRIAAIGPATAAALRDHGIEPDAIPSRYMAEGIVACLLSNENGHVEGKHFLLPRAAKARDVLPNELRKAGAMVDVIPAYETIPAKGHKNEVLARLEAGTLSCVTFGSSSTVENFLSVIPAAMLRNHPETKLAAIGPVTADTLRRHNLPCDIMPEKYTIPALIEALQTFFAR